MIGDERIEIETVQIKLLPSTPVDYHHYDLRDFCHQQASSYLQPDWSFKILSSFPYFKKHGYAQDVSQWSCWTVQMRVSSDLEWDVWVSVLRHKYVPPVLEHCNEILLISSKRADLHQSTNHNARFNSNNHQFLREKHEIIIDSMTFVHAKGDWRSY
jgi:hypothetical protein